jgi:hypothetical protein
MAMDLVDEIPAIGKIAPAVHRVYRPVFESGSMEQLMRFLAMRDMPRGRRASVSESTAIPINTIRCWRRPPSRRPCPHRPARVGLRKEAAGRVRLGGSGLSSGERQLSCLGTESRVAGPRMRCPPEPPARRFRVFTRQHSTSSPLSGECALLVRFPRQGRFVGPMCDDHRWAKMP